MVDVNRLAWRNVVKATSSWRKSVETLNGARQMSRRSEAARITPGAEYVAANAGAFIARLQEIVRHWPSADRLARATGVSPSAFRKWLRGDAEPSRERLVALAKAAGVSVGWLASGEGPPPRLSGGTPSSRSASGPGGINQRDYLLLPKRPESAAAGVESPPAEGPAEFFALHHDWVRSEFGIEPDHLSLETAVGESMLPNIQDGDLLLVDTTENRFRSFGVYVLEIAGERLVKRVQPKLDGSLTLISDNKAYEPEHIPPTQAGDITVVGRVIWTCGPTRGSR
jgi:phage repressor protein C with HTH and peptisase S24 domain